MRWRALLRQILVVLGLLAVALTLVCLCFLRELAFVYNIPMDYVVEAEFRELPPDDQGLKDWLFGQPGVYIGFVQRDGNRVVACWGNMSTFYWNAVTPDLKKEFEKLGYMELVSYREKKSYRDK